MIKIKQNEKQYKQNNSYPTVTAAQYIRVFFPFFLWESININGNVGRNINSENMN